MHRVLLPDHTQIYFGFRSTPSMNGCCLPIKLHRISFAAQAYPQTYTHNGAKQFVVDFNDLLFYAHLGVKMNDYGLLFILHFLIEWKTESRVKTLNFIRIATCRNIHCRMNNKWQTTWSDSTNKNNGTKPRFEEWENVKFKAFVIYYCEWHFNSICCRFVI